MNIRQHHNKGHTLSLFNMGDDIGPETARKGSGHIRTAMLRRHGNEVKTETFDDILGQNPQTKEDIACHKRAALVRTTYEDGHVVDYADARNLTDDATEEFMKSMYDHIMILGGGGSVLNAAKGIIENEDDQKVKHQIDLVKGIFEHNKNPHHKATNILGICLGAEIVAAAIGGTKDNNYNIVVPKQNEIEFGMINIGFDDNADQSGASEKTRAFYGKLKEAWTNLPIWQWHSNGFKNPEGSIGFLKNTDKPIDAEKPYDKEHECSQGFALVQENDAKIIGIQGHPEATKDFHLKDGKQWMKYVDFKSAYAALKKKMCSAAKKNLSDQCTTHAEAMQMDQHTQHRKKKAIAK